MKFGLSTEKYYWLATAISIVILILNIGVLAVNIFGVPKHPPIYGLERFEYYDKQTKGIEEWSEKLSSGKYTILYMRDFGIATDMGDKHIMVFGKIKK